MTVKELDERIGSLEALIKAMYKNRADKINQRDQLIKIANTQAQNLLNQVNQITGEINSTAGELKAFKEIKKIEEKAEKSPKPVKNK
jgi:hypothetical protein